MRTAINPIRVMAGQLLRVTCRDRACKRPIDLRMNTNGKWVPFTAGAAPLHTEQDPVTHVRHELMSRDDLHFAACKARRDAAGAGASA